MSMTAPTAGCSCYNLTDEGWLPVVIRPFMAGSYTWTGFDYRGEPNPYGWPDISNNTGPDGRVRVPERQILLL